MYATSGSSRCGADQEHCFKVFTHYPREGCVSGEEDRFTCQQYYKEDQFFEVKNRHQFCGYSKSYNGQSTWNFNQMQTYE